MEHIHGNNEADEDIVHKFQHLPNAGAHIGHQAGNLGDHIGLHPFVNIRKVASVVFLNELHHPLVLTEGFRGPIHQLLHLGRQCIPERDNALHQLRNHHGDQSIHNQNAHQQGEDHRKGVGKPTHFFWQPQLEKGLQGIAHGPQQIGNDAAIDKGGQNGTQLADHIPDTLEPVQEEEKQHTEADGTEPRHHGIKIPLFLWVFHGLQLVSDSFRISIPVPSKLIMNKL